MSKKFVVKISHGCDSWRERFRTALGLIFRNKLNVELKPDTIRWILKEHDAPIMSEECREAFEAEYIEKYGSRDRLKDFGEYGYADASVNSAWWGWETAHNVKSMQGDSRKAFEKWYQKDMGWPVADISDRRRGDYYDTLTLTDRWVGWQASWNHRHNAKE